METEGAKRVFERSVEKHNLRYVKFLGDGNSKSYQTVKNTYPDIEVEKLDYVGHYQKRIGASTLLTKPITLTRTSPDQVFHWILFIKFDQFIRRSVKIRNYLNACTVKPKTVRVDLGPNTENSLCVADSTSVWCI